MFEMSLRHRFFFLALSCLLGSYSLEVFAADYRKATDGHEVVMNKLHPKSGKFEFSVPDVGFIMNQSYVNTLLLGGAVAYHFDERLGFNLGFNVGLNSDKPERTCIENFYYDPRNEVGAACGPPENLVSQNTGNPSQDRFPLYGPAYVPIREIDQILLANVLWSPIYGKQLFFMSTTSYFDLFLEAGVGLATSRFYDEQDVLRNGNKSRGDYYKAGDLNEALNQKIGATASEIGAYGVAGRPDPQSDTNVLVNLGLGQKFYFGRFFAKLYVRNMTLLGSDKGFENLIILYGGAGMSL